MITFYAWSQPKGISHYNSRIWGCSQRFGFSVWRLITFLVNLTRFGVSWPSARVQRFLLSALTYGAQLRPSSGRVRFRDTSDMVLGWTPQHDCARTTSVSSSLNWGSAHRGPPKHREFVWACSRGGMFRKWLSTWNIRTHWTINGCYPSMCRKGT